MTAYPHLGRDQCFLGLDDRLNNPESAGVVVVQVPFERTSSYGTGSANGPAAIIAASHEVELFDTHLGFEACEASDGIATLAPTGIDDGDDGASVADKAEEIVGHWLERNKTVVTLAGEHTGIVGAVRAHARRFENLTVLQLDAHSDLRETYHDDPWNHACTMARILDFHEDIVQAGIRSEAREERERVEGLRLPVFRGEAIQHDDRRGEDWVSPIVEACSENVYMTFDCDVLDPSIMPSTGTPEPGGLTWMQVDRLFARLCEKRNVVGFDLSELAPVAGVHHPQFTAAKLIYRILGYLVRDAANGRA